MELTIAVKIAVFICMIICCIATVLSIYFQRKYDKTSKKVEMMHKELEEKKKKESYLRSEKVRLEEECNQLEKNINKLEAKIDEIIEKNPNLKDAIEYKKKKKNSFQFTGKKAIIGTQYPAMQTVDVMESLGFKVEVVKSGIAIFDKIANGEKFDLIITNSMYHEKYDGIDLLNQLKSEIVNFDIPVVVHTVSNEPSDYFVDTLGFDGCLKKPMDEEEAKELFQKLLK